jgi:hypothetical protein
MARPGNPQMVKGAPSLNPAGRGAPFAKAVVEKAKSAAAAGSDGVISYGGAYQGGSGETSSKLTGEAEVDRVHERALVSAGRDRDAASLGAPPRHQVVAHGESRRGSARSTR